MKKRELVLIKLGGSLITDKTKPYTAKIKIIKRLTGEVKIAWDKNLRFLICHGSGSFGHTSASKYKTAYGLKKKEDAYGLAKVQKDALQINRITKVFSRADYPSLKSRYSTLGVYNQKGETIPLITKKQD